MADSKRFYWLKLDRDFFHRHDVMALQRLGGAEAVNLYLWLLCESANHNGELRFSETLPYNAKRIYLATGINEDVVTNILDALKDLDLMQVRDDGTLFLTHLSKMVGFETAKAEYMRDKRREGKNKEEQNGTMFPNVPICSNNEEQNGTLFTEKEIEIEKEIEKEKDIDKSISFKSKTKSKTFPPLPDFDTFETFFFLHFGYNPSDLINLYNYIRNNNIKDWQLAAINWATGGKRKGGET